MTLRHYSSIHFFYHHVVFITQHTFTLPQAKWAIPGEGTPSMLGDMDVPPFWPPFLTFWGLNSIFLGYFFSSTNTTTTFWGIRNTNSYKIRSFWPQIPFFPRSLWVQFSAASGTPPSVFGQSTHINLFPMDKMAAISQTIYPDTFSSIKRFAFWLKFNWTFSLKVL